MADVQQSLGLDASDRPTRAGELPRGLTIVPAYVSTDVEAALLDAIDGMPWQNSLKRRVQHYGFPYDYRRRSVRQSCYLGPLPAFLMPIVARLRRDFDFDPNQAIVNEYAAGQGIAPHIDALGSFGERVVMIGLRSDVEMDFAEPVSGQSGSILFRHGDLVMIEGDARKRWTHAIAKRKADKRFGTRRDRRVSITFRSVVAGED
jgi:alkylated DNA repair dioxygenase AlkB